jgi:hypothetical protein
MKPLELYPAAEGDPVYPVIIYEARLVVAGAEDGIDIGGN